MAALGDHLPTKFHAVGYDSNLLHGKYRAFPHEIPAQDLEREFPLQPRPRQRRKTRKERDAQLQLDNIVRTDTKGSVKDPNQLDMFDPLNLNYGKQ